MLLSGANIRKTILYFKRNGFKDTVYATMERVEEKRKPAYIYEEPEEQELERQRGEKFENTPLISIVVPCYETKPVFLEDLVLSIEEQTYSNFQIVLADASRTKIVLKMAKELQETYGNIDYHHLSENKGISDNTNEGLKYAKGQYIALLDHDDVLTKDALYNVVKAINDFSGKALADGPVLIYTDEDKADTYLDKFYEPNRKPRLNEELILTNNYICHLSVYRADVIKNLQLRREYDGAQDFDLVLRTLLFAKNNYGKNWKEYVMNIPKVLYHWRCHESSTAENPASKEYAYESGLRAVENYVEAMGWKANVSRLKHVGFYRINYENDIFDEREDIGCVGGPLYRGSKITGGALDGKGRTLYSGLKKGYSGYLHRAVLTQNVDALDIRNIRIREQLEGIFEKETGLSYPLSKDVIEKLTDKEAVSKSIKFAMAVKNAGYSMFYDPEMK